MDHFSGHIKELIEQLSSLPGVGNKTAQRLAFHIINMPEEKARALSDAIIEAKENVHECSVCHTLTDEEICPICRDEERDRSVIMVVENSRDLAAYEKTGRYKGVYHVLRFGSVPGNVRKWFEICQFDLFRVDPHEKRINRGTSGYE